MDEALLCWVEMEGRFVWIGRTVRWGNPVELPGDRDRTTVIGAFAQLYLPHKSSLVTAMPSLGGTDHPVGRLVRPACRPSGRS